MMIKISLWNGREMILVKEVKIHDMRQIPNELKWMKDNNICGNYEFVAENGDEKELLKIMNNISQNILISRFTKGENNEK